MAPYPLAQGTLQHVAGDFDQTALSSFAIYEGNLGGCSQFQSQGQTTTPGAMFPTLCYKYAGSLMSSANQYREDQCRRQGIWFSVLT